MSMTVEMTVEQRCEELLTTPEAFARWLSTQPPDAIVGVAHDPCKCPIAFFLGAHGVPDVHIGRTAYLTPKNGMGFNDEDWCRLAQWAQVFIAKVDLNSFMSGRRSVPAVEAYEHLSAAVLKVNKDQEHSSHG